MTTRTITPGMGQAVAERTILRKIDGVLETWGNVADRVALGNTLLVKDCPDYEAFRNHLRSATILMSGRHLQHGDETQPSRNLEVFSNCSSAATSFLLFYLLLNGAGVGRCYDDDMMLVNWDNAPTVRCVIDETHADYDFSIHESVRDAKHKYGQGDNVHWFKVPDSREGWGQAIEMYETMAFQKAYRDELLILDFSDVRCKNSPIGGMQNRPSSGPAPLMNAIHKMATLKGAGLPRWLQAMYIDHYAAEPVLVGGARRAARAALKIWTDKSVLDFIRIKRPIEYTNLSMEQVVKYRKDHPFAPQSFLWSSNNSVMVDADFWRRLNLTPDQEGYNSELTRHAREVHRLVTECSYGDGNGEPGYLNVDMLTHSDEGKENLLDGNFVGSRRYKISDQTKIYLAGLAKRAATKKYSTIVNPCVPGETRILTRQGYQEIELLVDKSVEIWNGKEWSETIPFSTGLNPTVLVELSDGTSLRCTPTHEWILNGNVKVAASDLNVGDKLEKFSMPVIEEGQTLGSDDEAYSQGFYSGDGNKNRSFSWLYDPKYCVEDRLIGAVNPNEKQGRKRWVHGTMKPKNWVPHGATGNYIRNWFAGLCDADGTATPWGIQLGSIDKEFLLEIRLLLTRLGVQAKINNAAKARWTDSLPGGTYYVQDSYRLLINAYDTELLNLPTSRLKLDLSPQRDARRFVTVISVTDDEPCETFCFKDLKNGTGTFEGIVTGQCFEVPFNLLGAYCVIGSAIPYHAETLQEAEDAFKHIARSLVRVNTMDNIYAKETKRTNRIAVGQLGVHEFAWKFFRVGFRDLIRPDFEGYRAISSTYTPFVDPYQIVKDLSTYMDAGIRAAAFWECQGLFSRATVGAAYAYSDELGVKRPHTCTMIAPNGTIAKLFLLTEGWHLPAMEEFMRWVQFRHDDPLVQNYKDAGYRTQDLKTYEGTTIVGFPTAPAITKLGMGDALVLAGDATPVEQYEWVRLGEFFWIEGGSVSDYLDHNTPRPGEKPYGGQISYTLKFKPEDTKFPKFLKMLTEGQPTVRACCVMPQTSNENSSYEYQPEEPVSKEVFEAALVSIAFAMGEDVGREHVDCSTGSCPITFNEGKKE